MTDRPARSLSESLTSARRMAFYEGHKAVAVVMILVVFLLPFVGLFVRGLIGAASGVIISVLCYYLTPYLAQMVKTRADR